MLELEDGIEDHGFTIVYSSYGTAMKLSCGNREEKGTAKKENGNTVVAWLISMYILVYTYRERY